MKQPFTRRDFFRGAVAGAGLAALGANAQTPAPKIAGFDETDTGKLKNTVWKPVSDRKVKVGIKEIFLGRPSFATPTCSLSGRESA